MSRGCNTTTRSSSGGRCSVRGRLPHRIQKPTTRSLITSKSVADRILRQHQGSWTSDPARWKRVRTPAIADSSRIIVTCQPVTSVIIRTSSLIPDLNPLPGSIFTAFSGHRRVRSEGTSLTFGICPWETSTGITWYREPKHERSPGGPNRAHP